MKTLKHNPAESSLAGANENINIFFNFAPLLGRGIIIFVMRKIIFKGEQK
jgi:hypothetical protein